MAPDVPVPVPSSVPDIDRDIASVAALGDPLRRTLYRYVVAQAAPVNRDQAANAVGVARHTAKFHLDRLVADRLLDIEFARPGGRSGPGAGRPAKLYRRTTRDIAVSFPDRHYDLAGQLLARAVSDAHHTEVPVVDALDHAARRYGRTLANDARQHLDPDPNPSSAGTVLAAVLTASGYQPHEDGDGIVLANCPFHALAQEYTDLICGMNLQLLNSVIETLGERSLSAILDPAPGRCCVRVIRLPTRSG